MFAIQIPTVLLFDCFVWLDNAKDNAYRVHAKAQANSSEEHYVLCALLHCWQLDWDPQIEYTLISICARSFYLLGSTWVRNMRDTCKPMRCVKHVKLVKHVLHFKCVQCVKCVELVSKIGQVWFKLTENDWGGQCHRPLVLVYGLVVHFWLIFCATSWKLNHYVCF